MGCRECNYKPDFQFWQLAILAIFAICSLAFGSGSSEKKAQDFRENTPGDLAASGLQEL
jgi:hypothetical protein